MKKIISLLLLNTVFAVSAQNITWTNVTATYNMPIGVQVYAGEDSSIPLKIKYIDVDLNTTDLEVSPVLSTPTNAKNWATKLGAVAVMNGGYFGGSSSFSSVVNTTVEAKNVASLNRSGIDYPVTRGFFGFNTDGTMAVNWIYHFGNAKTDIYSFASPTPNTNGSPAPTPTQAGGTQWTSLAKGMGAGPVLIKNGTIVDTYDEEVFWGSGVSNTGLDPRSAIGYTNNKHLILLVADGRQTGISAGASLPQMASILKNLGCIEALNCDGGGSTQLATPNTYINTPSESYRSVPSVWAIFKKANLETPNPIVPLDRSSTEINPVNISWNMPTETGCTYRIQIATSKVDWNKNVGFTPETSTNTNVLVNEENATGSFNFSNLTLGTTYYWTVVAYKNGSFKSNYTEPRSFTFSNSTEVGWKRATIDNNKPDWFGTDTERGLAYANNKIYVVSRNGVAKVKILNFIDGKDVGELPVTGITGGTFSLNDIEGSENGMLLGCNMTTSTGTSNFKVYKWENDAATPSLFIDYSSSSNLRLGDKFTIQGDITKNAVILAAGSAGTKIVRWLVIDGVLQTPTEITLPVAMGNFPCVAATGTNADSDLIVNSQAKNIILYSSTGVNKGSLGNTIVDSDSNATKYFELDGKKYLAVFQSKQTASSPLGNNCRIVDITGGFASATIVSTTDRLGNDINGNAAGDIDVRYSNSPISLAAITLATNNGISAKKIFGEIIAGGNSNNLKIEQYNIEDHSSVSFYPNPVDSEFTVSITDALESNCSLKIYSLEGKLVQFESIIKNIQNIKTNSFSNGIYIIKIQNGGKQYQSKLVKS
ncbi:DUF4623 domain-containing protein [Flavobacterium sp.]|jgi:hypothetical protein|uniref:DUF4623 domain-containing protein n=1 Tax=Flavobacterium sp. TaxID=239 RepID=UPI0037BEA142